MVERININGIDPDKSPEFPDVELFSPSQSENNSEKNGNESNVFQSNHSVDSKHDDNDR